MKDSGKVGVRMEVSGVRQEENLQTSTQKNVARAAEVFAKQLEDRGFAVRLGKKRPQARARDVFQIVPCVHCVASSHITIKIAVPVVA